MKAVADGVAHFGLGDVIGWVFGFELAFGEEDYEKDEEQEG